MGKRVGQIAKAPEVKQSNSNSWVRRTKRLQSMDSPVDRILYLQRTVGNQAVSRLIKSGALQAKLRIGQPGDVYEQEADRVADTVMRMPEPGVQRQVDEEEEEETLQSKPLANQIAPLVQVQRQEEPEEEEEMLQAKSREDATSEVPNDLESQINAIRGGQPLAESERAYFEPRFGADFSRVRVHTGAQAAESSRAVNAKAYTLGQDVVFGIGQYAPKTSQGRRLMAHELAHVIQQSVNAHNFSLDKTKSIRKKPFFQRLKPLVRRVNNRKLQRQVEVHVNLNLKRSQKVKLYQKGKNDKTFDPVSAGPATKKLISLDPYSIKKREHATKKVGEWGLQYFAIFSGEIGFHSNIAYPKRRTLCKEKKKYCKPKSDLDIRKKYKLKVDGTPRSHGCVRMFHKDAKKLFNTVSNGTSVRVYDREKWRKPKWA